MYVSGDLQADAIRMYVWGRKVSGVGEHVKHHDPSPKIVVHCHFSSLCKIGRESGHGALQHKN